MKEFPSNKFPLNLAEEEKYFFENKTVKFVIPAKTRLIKNAFISHEGLVLKNGFLIKRCAFNLKGKQDNTFYYPFWRKAIEQHLVSKFGKSLVVHNFKERPLLLFYTKWFNYAFWITDCLLRLTIAEEEGWLDKALVIYPEEWENIPYVLQSLEAFKFEKYKLPAGEHVFSSRLVMPETREWTSSFSSSQLMKVKNRLFQYEETIKFEKKFPNKIYLTRAFRGIRSVDNESEVLELLMKYKYESVIFEKLSFWEQVHIMKNATHFISIHGAGFSNILFMNQGANVIELINKSYAEKEYNFPFWHLANANGLTYIAQFCRIKDSENNNLHYGIDSEINEEDFLVNQNVIVDLELLKSNLNCFEK